MAAVVSPRESLSSGAGARGWCHRDFAFSWCYYPYAGAPDAVHCMDYLKQRLAARGATVANWITYDNQEAYSDAVLACPELDLRLDSSRVYHLLVLPHHASQNACAIAAGDAVGTCDRRRRPWPCCLWSGRKEGRKGLRWRCCAASKLTTVVRRADVLMLHYDGVDSKSLMLHTMEQVGRFQAFLGLPNYPVPANAPWDVNATLMPAYNEWLRRLLLDYRARYGALQSFVGLYQPQELCLCGTLLPNVVNAYAQTGPLVRSLLPGTRV